MNMPFISSREAKKIKNISFVASPLMKYAFFASLDEINGIFIPKIWISSIYLVFKSREKVALQWI